MSCTEVYGFGKDGDASLIGEVQNSFRGAMQIWMFLEKKYLPPTKHYRILTGGEEETQKIWDLVKDERLTETEKIVLLSTFDKVVVKKENFEILIAAFCEFPAETSLMEQAKIIHENDVIAVAWNQTSVSSNPWSIWFNYINERDIPLLKKNDYCFVKEAKNILEEGYRPYNLFEDKGHWFLFEEIHLKKTGNN